MDIRARIPGTIIDVKVKTGDNVAAREALGVMEAMKMETPIPSPIAGEVKAVNVAVGDKVKTGQVMFVVG